ncbi:hypothetical protein FQN54_001038 [Arachnomyces sp. PD_36]|nr:hypothetical protein FQN54_001038 [Arachnomyces sp. PD_36]
MDNCTPNTRLSSIQVCDCCRRRKLKCDRLYPCGSCKTSLLHCSYNHVLQRKGPKRHKRSPRVSVEADDKDRGSPGSSTFYTFHASSSSSEDLDGGSPSTSTAASSPPASVVAPKEVTHIPENEEPLLLPPPLPALPQPPRLSALVVLAHVSVYLKYLFPIMPVFDPQTVIQDSSDPGSLPPERYALLVSLCAITHIQLKLDGPGFTDEGTLISGDALLSEAVRARNEYNTIEHASVDSLLTSFYLFASYGNLEKHCHASFYLNQAVCMVHTLGLNRESVYSDMETGEAENCRRVFWLIFVSERAYALQQSKPVMSRNSIRKPEPLDADDPNLAYGFLNVINIFEKLPVELYDFICSGCEDEASGFALASFVQSSLNFSLSLEGVAETQLVDILVTQQWLQGVMWKFGLSRSPHKLLGNRGSIPFNAPLSAAHSIMEVLSSVSQTSIDAHGISMVRSVLSSYPWSKTNTDYAQEQKLFDVGTYVADVARIARSSNAMPIDSTTSHPNVLLWGIVNALSNIRGSQSHLLPILLELSEDVLELESPPIPLPTLTLPDDPLVSHDYWQPNLPKKQHQHDTEAQRAALESYASELQASF